MMKNLLGSGVLGDGLSAMAAKGVASGLIKRYAKEWTIDGFKEAAEKDYGIMQLFEVSPEWAATLRGGLKKYKALQKISANELLSWVQDANPILFNQVCQEPAVVAWLFKSWESGKAELLSMDS
jgi:hypothetical protein|tara:strand:+ start:4393 stop:4764 length:372 start_codon:yes stop_codon:yes gene_type:complete